MGLRDAQQMKIGHYGVVSNPGDHADPYSSDRVIEATKDLTDSLRHPAPEGPMPPSSVEQANTLLCLAKIFATRADAPTRVAPAPKPAPDPRQGMREEPKPETRADPPPKI